MITNDQIARWRRRFLEVEADVIRATATADAVSVRNTLADLAELAAVALPALLDEFERRSAIAERRDATVQ